MGNLPTIKAEVACSSSGRSSGPIDKRYPPVVFQSSDPMADFDDLDVLLVDFETGSPLVKYDTAKTIPKNSSRQRRCAVEAKADQRFAVQVCVKPTFDWADSNGLAIKLGFDVGEEVNCRSVYVLREESSDNSLDLPCFTHDDSKDLIFCIDHLAIVNPKEDIHLASQAQFFFRHLRDDHLVASKPRHRSLESQGKIRIEVSRVRISARRHESLQTDSTPTYRRQTKRALWSKGITLEVLLHVSPELEQMVCRGNFKSDQSKTRKQQTNFDFIYREVGQHDEFVDKDDIIEVRSTKQDPDATSSTRSSVCPRSTRTPMSTSSDPQQEISAKSESGDSGASPSPAPNVSQHRPLTNDAATVADNGTAGSIDAENVPHVVEPCNQRGEAHRPAVDLDNSIEELVSFQEFAETRRRILRLALHGTDEIIAAAYQAQMYLEQQQRQLARANEERRQRIEEAVVSFLDTVRLMLSG